QAGGPDGIREMLKDPEKRERVREYLEHGRLARNPNGDRAIFIDTQSGRYVGQSLQEAAEEAGMGIGDFAIQMLEEEHPYALMIYLRGTPPDDLAVINRDTIRHPAMMVASDGMYH